MAVHMTDLVSVSEAANLVPYSRDHITRLAREGKVLAVQVARRWMVSAVSLQRFYESCRHEDAVRQHYLSEARRRDLEIAEHFKTEHARIATTYSAATPALWYSTTIVLSGLLCGVLLHTSLSSWSLGNHLIAHISTSTADDISAPPTQVASVGTAFVGSLPRAGDSRVPAVETRELSLENGLVLLPLTASSTLRSEDFFSDDVMVEMIDDTQGMVRLSSAPDAPVLNILRLPSSNEADVTTRAP